MAKAKKAVARPRVLPRNRVLTFYQNFYICNNGTITIARGPGLHRTILAAKAEEKVRQNFQNADRKDRPATDAPRMSSWHFIATVEFNLKVPSGFDEWFSEESV